MAAYLADPVLRLLPPEPPDAFLLLKPDEQRWRGRLWIAMYGAGYEPDHAWWFVLQGDDDWIAFGRELVSRIPDDQGVYASMIKARQQFDAQLAAQAELPQ